MTFSIVGHCTRTNMTGVAVASSSMGVAGRCPWVRASIGAVATQNMTDPSLGPLILDYIEQGLCAQDALDKVTEGRENIEYRQLTVVDTEGDLAHFTGSEMTGTHKVVEGASCVAAGNTLSSNKVPLAMAEQFEAGAKLHLGERLLLALKAGVDAGGEEGSIHSSGLKVADDNSWPLVDLRIDWTNGEPVGELYELWKTFESEMNTYTIRAIDPSKA